MSKIRAYKNNNKKNGKTISKCGAHLTLRLRVLPDKVSGDSDGQLAAELLPLEAVQGVALAVGADQDVELVLELIL
jgi:hypothetical protein